jgi:nucleoid-associated protein YgaU
MNRFRALFLGFATATSAAALAAYNGVFDGPGKPIVEAAVPADPVKLAEPVAEAAKAEPAAPVAAKTPEAPVEVAKADPTATVEKTEAPVEVKPAVPAAATPEVKTDTPASVAAMAPEFGLLRAEPDGSLLVAGKGTPNADIELITGDTVLGNTKAEANGDFALVLNDPLKAGDYSMVLRTTNPDGKAATSVQTAIVSIPQDLKGQVLAMIEEPGKASRIITAPEAVKPAEVAVAEPAKEAAPAAEKAPEAEVAKAAEPTAEPAKSGAEETVAAAGPQAPAAGTSARVTIPLANVVVEAVEIEGNKIFVAGSAPAGSTIRIYATETLLGETKATENNRFLLEASRDLAVGDYFIHADTIGPDGKLISRVTVPFTREAGETVVAVAPAEPAKDPAAAEPAAPAETAAAAEPEAPKASETAQAEPAAPAKAEPEVQAAAKSAEPAADVTLAPALTKADASVIIRRGDSLWRISRRIYGRGVRYSTIYLANKDKVTNPNRIWPGQVMMIPEKTTEGEAADMAEIERRKKAAEAQ